MNHQVKTATHSDLKKISSCHRAAFPASLASALGSDYVGRMFDWYLSTNHAFLFFVYNQDEIIGYCGGMIVDGTLPHGSASSITQHTFNDAILALLKRPWLFFHPDFLRRYGLFARNISTRIRNGFRKVEVRSAKPPSEPYVGLVVIGVAPTFQGKGYGSILLAEFERISREKGLSKMILTVKSDNNQAIRSYESNGWVKVKSDGQSTSMEKRVH